MIGRQKTYRVQLTFIRKKAVAANLRTPAKQNFSIAKRAKIILKVDENPDWTDAQIAGIIDCSAALVRKWRKL